MSFFAKLTDKDRNEVKALAKSNPLVKRMVEEIQSFYEDPTRLLYKEIVETTKVLASDLKLVRNPSKISAENAPVIISDDKDDKLYDRVMKVITDSSKIFDGIERGRRAIDPEGAEADRLSKTDSGSVII